VFHSGRRHFYATRVLGWGVGWAVDAGGVGLGERSASHLRARPTFTELFLKQHHIIPHMLLKRTPPPVRVSFWRRDSSRFGHVYYGLPKGIRASGLENEISPDVANDADLLPGETVRKALVRAAPLLDAMPPFSPFSPRTFRRARECFIWASSEKLLPPPLSPSSNKRRILSTPNSRWRNTTCTFRGS